MNNKDTEKLLRSAFSKSAPQLSEALLPKETKGSATIMSETKKSRKGLKIAIVAAALAAALSVTAAAVSFTGLIDRHDAFAAAYNHLYETAEGEEKQFIANMILAGTAVEDEAEVIDADIGLKGLRPVYNLTFTIGETVYHYTVDAKTAVIISSSSEPYITEEKPTHETHEFAISEAEKNANYNRTYAIHEARDHFGCHMTTSLGGIEMNIADFSSDVYSCEEGYYEITFWGGGYMYRCKVDMSTGEIYDDEIAEDDLYTGSDENKVMVHKVEGVVGLNKAIESACEAVGKEYTLKYTGDVALAFAEYYPAGSFSGYLPYNQAAYIVNTRSDDGECHYKIYVDAVTGEVLSVTLYGSRENADTPYGEQNNTILASYAVMDRFGLTNWSTPYDMQDYMTVTTVVEPNADGNYNVAAKFDGYIYRCTVDPNTLEILTGNVEEDMTSTERTLHQGDPEMIGRKRAIEIAAEHVGIEITDDTSIYAGCVVEESGQKVYDVGFHSRMAPFGTARNLHIDCYTGEIVYEYNEADGLPNAGLEADRNSPYSEDETKPYEPNEIPSTDSMDGEISEAAAVIAALEDLGVTDQDVLGLEINREGGEFAVKFYIADIETVYHIDAKSGKIVSKSGATSDMIIPEETAVNILLQNLRIKREALWDMGTVRRPLNNHLVYTVAYYYGGRRYESEIDALSGTPLTVSYPIDLSVADADTEFTEEDFLNAALSVLGIKDYGGYDIRIVYRDSLCCAEVTVHAGKEDKSCFIDIDTLVPAE